tara:strand:+ start:5020 stop:6174 length:1155 start_codon:yes stop_codon:yes gene_type:complete
MANIFSKAWKGIKKVAKKIGKGIKKVVKKIGRAVGKLGIVGQIGMMFLMPYAMQGLGSLFGQFAGGVADTWASSLLSKSNIAAKALGHTMNAIHTVGTTVMKPFTFIRDQIGKSIDWIGETTGTSSLTDGVNKLIGYDSKKVSADVGITEISDSSLMGSGGSATETLGGEYIQSDAFTPEGMKSVSEVDYIQRMRDSVDVNNLTASTTPAGTLTDTGATFKSESILGRTNVGPEVTSPSPISIEDISAQTFQALEEGQPWTSKAKEWVIGQRDSVVNSFKDFDVGEDIINPAIRQGGASKLAYTIAGDPPQQKILQTIREEPNLFALSNMFGDSSIFRNVNMMSEQRGNVWAGTNLLNYDYVKSVGNDGTADYYNNMRGLELMA